MKLHRLLLSDFRGVAHREIIFPDSGAILIEGENEVGKTSMIEALDLLITEKDSSSKAAVRAIKPVNADVGSVVEAEISSGPYRFVYRKQFNRSAGTTLSLSKPAARQLTGNEAHEKVQAILAETLDMALWKALRMMQGQPLTQLDLAESGSLTGALDRAAGTTAHQEGNDPLVSAVEAEYLLYYTKTGKITGQYRLLEDQLDSVRRAVEAAKEAVAEVALDVAKHESLSSQLEQLTTQESDTEQELTELTEQIEAWQELESRLAAANAARQVAAQTAERAEQDQLRRTELIESEHKRTAETAAIQAQIEQKNSDEEQLAKQLTLQQQLAETHKEQADGDRHLAETIRADVEHLQNLEEADRLRVRLEAIAQLRHRVAENQRILAVNSVDASTLADLEQAKAALDIAQATHRASAAHLSAQSLDGNLDVEIDGNQQQISATSAHEISLTKPVNFVLPGMLKLVLRPAADAGDLASAVDRASNDLNNLLAHAKATDIVQARLLHERRRTTDDELRSVHKEIDQLLSSDDESALNTRLVQLDAQLESYRTSRDGTQQLAADAATAKTARQEAEIAERASRVAADQALETLGRYQHAWHASHLELGVLSSSLTVQAHELGNTRDALARGRASISDEQLATQTRDAQQHLLKAQELAEHISAELAESDLVRLRVRRQNAEELLLSVHRQLKSIQSELAATRARLEVAGGQGRQEALDTAESLAQAIASKHQAITARAEAAQLLHHTMQRHRDQAKQQYVAPFQNQINTLGKFVYGDSFSAEVDSSLRITTRTLDGLSVPYDALSAGAKEQLEIMTRLACAAMVDPDEGVPLMIDDALGYSDPGRIRLLSALLGTVASGSDTQIFLFTCTPGRWSVGSAETIRLERSR